MGTPVVPSIRATGSRPEIKPANPKSKTPGSNPRYDRCFQDRKDRPSRSPERCSAQSVMQSNAQLSWPGKLLAPGQLIVNTGVIISAVMAMRKPFHTFCHARPNIDYALAKVSQNYGPREARNRRDTSR